MPDDAHYLGREQKAKADFVAAMTSLRQGVPAGPMLQGFDALAESVTRFGAAILRTRQADRLRMLGLDSEEEQRLRASAVAENDRGLASLAAVRPLADFIAAQETTETDLSAWREHSSRLRADWLETIKNVELDPPVVGQLHQHMEQICAALDESGRSGLGAHVGSLVNQLEAERRAATDDDSAVAQRAATSAAAAVPAAVIVAKVLMCAILMGVTAAVIYNLLSSGAPWWNFYLVALIACILITLVALGC